MSLNFCKNQCAPTPVRSHHELRWDGGFELQTRGTVCMLEVIGTLLRRIKDEDFYRFDEFSNVPPLDLKIYEIIVGLPVN